MPATVIAERIDWTRSIRVLSARVADPDLATRALSDLGEAGIAVTELALGQPSLDEVFLALTGHTAEQRDAEEDAA